VMRIVKLYMYGSLSKGFSYFPNFPNFKECVLETPLVEDLFKNRKIRKLGKWEIKVIT